MRAKFCPILPIGRATYQNLNQQLFDQGKLILTRIFLRASGNQAMTN